MPAGAVIVAAGLSSRMGNFKPMLNIGSISIAQRVVTTFQQAGVDNIVVVTGHNAFQLERHLSGNGIVFLRNERYASTQMFESAKIGLRYLKDKCDTLLFTPIDIPLFTCKTVELLLQSGAKLACPVCDGHTGHPILIAAELVDEILAYSGEEGMRGACAQCSEEMRQIQVTDRGILYDADTPEDYSSLLKYHNSQLCHPEISVSLHKEKPFLDDRVALLLTLVEETQSVREACERMQISYSTGWNIIHTLETQANRPVVQRTQGGPGGSASELTESGRELLSQFQSYKKDVQEYARSRYMMYFEDIFS